LSYYQVSFFKEHHSDNVNFGQAGAHYSNIVFDYFEQKIILFVKKLKNPENFQETRAIEDFFSFLEGNFYENNLNIENLIELRNKIRFCLKIDLNLALGIFFESTQLFN